MSEQEFTIYYTDSEGNQGKADIEINLDVYGELLAEEVSILEIDEFILNQINSQVDVELKRNNIEDLGVVREEIKSAYEEYKEEMQSDYEDDDE